LYDDIVAGARRAGGSRAVGGGLADACQGDQKHVAPVEAHDDSLSGPFEIDAEGLGGDAQFEVTTSSPKSVLRRKTGSAFGATTLPGRTF
jgi:hypothetical protein